MLLGLQHSPNHSAWTYCSRTTMRRQWVRAAGPCRRIDLILVLSFPSLVFLSLDCQARRALGPGGGGVGGLVLHRLQGVEHLLGRDVLGEFRELRIVA